MSVSLAKGGNVSLTKMAPSLTAVAVGLGWDVRTTTGADFDLDASALVCGADGKVIDDSHFVFFNNLKSPDGSVEHTGDNLTGEGEGDDESINVDLGDRAGERRQGRVPGLDLRRREPRAVLRPGAATRSSGSSTGPTARSSRATTSPRTRRPRPR